MGKATPAVWTPVWSNAHQQATGGSRRERAGGRAGTLKSRQGGVKKSSQANG